MIIGVCAIFAGILLKISLIEMLIVVLTVGLVFTSEIFNSMVEETINLITDEHLDEIRLIKDMAAGAVLVSSIISLVVGYFIFIRRLVE